MDERARRALESKEAADARVEQALLLIAALGLASCTAGPARECGRPREATERAVDAPGVRPRAEVGLIDFDSMQYELQGRRLASSAVRLFYDFQPADVAPESAPLLVLAAGGPGAASMYMLAGGIGSYEMDEASDTDVVPSVTPFTDFANLLAIDSRNTGFSYETTGEPNTEAERRSRFAAHDYNVYVDAADSVRALLVFLEDHPALARCPVYWLAESYGGLRSTVASNMLLFHEAWAAGERAFHAEAVDTAIARFAERRFGSRSGSAEDMSAQFRGQILIQPLVGGLRQTEAAGALFEAPGSVIERLATEAGVDFIRCNEQPAPCAPYDNTRALLQRIERSRYDSRRTLDWEQRERRAVDGVATRRDSLAPVLGVEPAELDALFAERDSDAFRFADLTHSVLQPRGDLEQHWGELEPWDAYFVSTNSEVMGAFAREETAALEADPYYSGFGELLLENLGFMSAFVTRAEFDLALYSPAFVPMLETYPEVARAELRTGNWAEQIEIELRDGTTETLVAPRYLESGHAVYRDEPEKLYEDVARFVQER